MVKQKKSKAPTEKAASRINNDASSKTEGRIDDNIQTKTAPVDPSLETIEIIPVVEEDFDLTKKTIVHETTIVKKWPPEPKKLKCQSRMKKYMLTIKSSRYMKKKKDYYLE